MGLSQHVLNNAFIKQTTGCNLVLNACLGMSRWFHVKQLSNEIHLDHSRQRNDKHLCYRPCLHIRIIVHQQIQISLFSAPAPVLSMEHLVNIFLHIYDCILKKR